MEFLCMNLTKDLRLFLSAIYNLFYRRLLLKTILYSGFKKSKQKNPGNKKIRVFS